MRSVVPLARGGAASPKSPHATIRMDSEQVIIRLKKKTYTVDALFHLFNTGETTTEWVGFPKQRYDMTKSMPGFPVESDFIRFDTWIDGTKIEVEEESNPESNPEPGIVNRILSAFNRVLFASGLGSLPPIKERWLVHHITFPGHTRTTIRTSYESHYSIQTERKAYYIIGTGRLWKDNIGKAVFIIDSLDVGGTNRIRVNFPVAPGPRLLGNNLLRFEIEDAQPRPDARLIIEVEEPATPQPRHGDILRTNPRKERQP
ncbi:hypothetical protein [Desulfomonile tiedjei]|nr:hypothetical protein [Desulfomonile tiedjei]